MIVGSEKRFQFVGQLEAATRSQLAVSSLLILVALTRRPDFRSSGKNGQCPRCQVPVGGESGEGRGQIGADDPWDDKHQPEEAEAVQSSDSALHCHEVH